MLLLDIKPLHSRGACLQDLIVTAASHWNLSCELMYSEAWGFSFRSPEPDSAYLIGYGLEPDYETSLDDLYQYQGIEVTSRKADNSEEALAQIEANLKEGFPVIIYLDSFWTTWLGPTRVNHHDHFVLAIGMDKDAGILYCLDPPASKKTEQLAFADFLEGNDGRYASFRIHPAARPIDPVAWTSRLRNKLWPRDGEAVFDSIHRFAEAIADDRFDMKAEVALSAGEGIWMAPLVWGLINIAGGRRSVGIAASHVGERCSDPRFQRMASELDDAAKEWDSIRASLLKLNYLRVVPPGFKEKIVGQIRQLAERERTIAAAIVRDILGDRMPTSFDSDEGHENETLARTEGGAARQDTPEEVFTALKAVPVSLEAYCNNIGIGYARSSASLTCMDESEHFLLSEDREGRFWSDEAFGEFALVEPGRGKEDNVSCFGQRIAFAPGRYAGAALIGCAEWGSFEETAIVHYDDGTAGKAKLAFTDWHAEHPKFGERLLWQGESISYFLTDEYRNEGRKLFLRTLAFDGEKRATSIELPICPNIHLFACSLYFAE